MSAKGEISAGNESREDERLTSRLGTSDEEVDDQPDEDDRVGNKIEPVGPVAEQAQAEAESVEVGGEDAESRISARLRR
jgi:hypothetical protein